MRYCLIVVLLLWPVSLWAEEGKVTLFAPAELVETGVLRHALPRFSLKTQVRVTVVEDAAGADLLLGDSGTPVFNGLGRNWSLAEADTGHPGAARFAEWLTSEVGQRTVLGFTVDGATLFSAPRKVAQKAVKLEMDGDAEAGLTVSQAQCARCHAVTPEGRKNDIGSTPSFFVLRTFEDWEERFSAFFVLRPHPAFTQIEDVTEPFADHLPPAIVPVELTLDDLDNLLAYVATLEPLDLGAPLKTQ